MSVDILLSVFNIHILLYIILGVGAGICIGALPGLSATMGVTLLLPITFGLEATQGILLLLGVYIGAIYGGSVSAILLKIPGTPAAAATAIDGYEFSKRGESGRALGIATFSSFIGGIISCLILWFIAPILAQFALKFSNAEYFMLAAFGLTIIVNVSGSSMAKGLISGMIGILISTIGVDRITGHMRFTFDNPNLLSGISYIPIMIGLFAMSQAFLTIEEIYNEKQNNKKLSRIFLSKEDIAICLKTAPLSGIIGTIIGIIPGAGADIGAFVAYNEAKRISKRGDKFGTGLPEAVAASEAGNNGVTGGAMIPMLTLGIPGDAVAAIMIGALTIHGLQPGPLLFKDNPNTVYTIFFGLFIANIVMLILGFSCLRMFSKVLSIPKPILTPIIFVLCLIGSYAINNSFFDGGIMLCFGIIGYFMYKVDIPASPAILGLILGPLAENHFRTALLKSSGSYAVFVDSPITLFFLFMIVITLFAPLISYIKKRIKNSEENTVG